MDVTIVGAGGVGRALGLRWAARGQPVRFLVRAPDDAKHAALAATAGVTVDHLSAIPGPGGIIVLAVPWAAAVDTVAALGPIDDRIVIDCTNPVGFNAAGVYLLDTGGRSGGTIIAEAAPRSHVIKTLNQVGTDVMADPGPTPPLMFIAGDDAAAKADVMALVDLLGFAPSDAGPLANAGALEALALLWIDHAMRGTHGRNFAMHLIATPTTEAA